MMQAGGAMRHQPAVRVVHAALGGGGLAADVNRVHASVYPCLEMMEYVRERDTVVV
jgi:hypothetical protein